MSLNIYEENCRALQTVNPRLAKRLGQLADEGLYMPIESARKDQPNLLYKGLAPPILFYDRRDPLAHAERYLGRMLRGDEPVLILLGLGLGYAAELLLGNHTALKKLIIVEKEIACLKAAMGCRNFSNLLRDPRAILIAGCEDEDLYVTLYDAIHPHFPGLKAMKFLPWPASIRVSAGYYSGVVKALRQIADTYGSDRGNDPYDTLVGYEHFFANIGALTHHPGAGYVKDLFKGRPAVVVATGPSLKKNVRLLKSIEDSAVIVSADASLRILHQHNIFPHMVTTVERPPGFDAYYRGLQNLDKTVFAAASFVHPSTLAAYSGPVLFFHRIYNFMARLGFGEDAIQMGMSTANMAYEVARHMGCSPIILVGNDLAFDSTGNTHAEGFILGEKQPLYEEFDRIDVPGNCETLVKTCDGWFTCLKQYEKRIQGWEGKLINATEGGARIRMSDVMPLREAIERFCSRKFHPREVLHDHLERWENPRRLETLLETVQRFIEVTDSFTGTCKQMSGFLEATLREIEDAKGVLSAGLRRKLRGSVPHIETVLSSILDTELMQYFDEYFYSDIFPLLTEWQVIGSRFSDPGWADAYRIKLAENFFGALGQICTSLKEVLLDGHRRLTHMAANARETVTPSLQR